MSTVYILGSGFSKAINSEMPTLTELSEIVCEKFKDELDRFPLSKYKDNFEELLTYLYTEHPWKDITTIHKDKALYYEISNYIANVINEKQKSGWGSINQKVQSSFLKLIGDWKLCKQSVITFNYDTLIESVPDSHDSLHIASLWKIPILDVKDRVPVTRILADVNFDKLFYLVKLHGSTNWYFGGDFAVNNDRLYFSAVSPVYDYNNDIRQQNLSADLKPFLIPPVMDKSLFYKNNILKKLWDDAHRELSVATKIVIMGYSIPQTDYSTQMLLKSAIRDETEIVIVNTDTRDEFKKRMKDVFGDKIKDDFRYCCNDALSEYINNEI